MGCDTMIKISYDENFKVTGIGHEANFITTEPFILMDLTDDEFEKLLNTPMKALTVEVENNNVVMILMEEPVEEVADIERLKKENEELKERLAKIESLLGV